MIRYEHVVTLGGFPENIRLTEDLRFFGQAARFFGAFFLDRAAVQCQMSDKSLTRSLDIDLEEKDAEMTEIKSTIRQWQREIRGQLGGPLFANYYFRKSVYRLVTRPVVEWALVPALDAFAAIPAGTARQRPTEI